MATQQPQSTDYLNSPDHALSHRVVAIDDSAPAESVVVDASGKVVMANYTEGSILFFGASGIISESNTALFFESGDGGKLAVGDNSKMRNVFQAVKDDGTTDITNIKALVTARNKNTTDNSFAGFATQTLDTSDNVHSGVRLITQFSSHAENAVSGNLIIETRHAGTRSEKIRVTSNGKVGIGTDTPSEYADLTLEGGIICLKEASTPTADANYGKVYTKNDNKLYFQDGAGAEKEVDLVDDYYGEMYLDDNSIDTVIETADTAIMVRHAVAGALAGITFNAGSAGAITAYADGTGKVNVSSAGHGLSTGDEVSIRGTTNYNGIWTITKINDDSFSIPDTWVADDGASNWDEGSNLIAGTGAAGKYVMTFNLSCSEKGGAGSNVIGQVCVNSTLCAKCIAKRKYPNNDYGNLPGTAILELTEGDKLYFTIMSSGVNDIACQYGNLNIHRL